MTNHFSEDLSRSLSDTKNFPLDDCLAQLFPDYLCSRETSEAIDRAGSDLEIFRKSGHDFADLKVRDEDPRIWGADDLAVELYSVFEKRIRGYQNRKADYLIWLFKPTGRAVMIEFRSFKKCYDANWDYWHFWRAESPQRTRMRDGTTYHSVHCYVPLQLFKAGVTEANVGRRSSPRSVAA
ncbi:hypothetical protein QEH56_08460 [Pelagicoccus enzymogenes]|uniref:hypothetical protein n=1 Tax=Pelagicoccus enzymogenes TaxID=2773457 RepID=UPI00280DB0B4|nr:hypothetical protein [Pelagicoccus enzymogenes]MDQ8198174.1 hypothetical protein [Pelagicoccus enzymogenes]